MLWVILEPAAISATYFSRRETPGRLTSSAMMSPLALMVVLGAVGKVTGKGAGSGKAFSSRSERKVRTVLVEGSLSEHLATVLEERLSELLRENVVSATLDGRVVDRVLHVVDLRKRRSASFLEQRAAKELTSPGSARFMMTMQRAVMSRSTVVRRPKLRTKKVGTSRKRRRRATHRMSIHIERAS